MRETVLFDTHRVIKRYISSGFTERQAEVLIEEQKSIIENNLANKQDIAETNLRIESFRKETSLRIEDFRKETSLKIEDFRKETHLKIETFRQETNLKIETFRHEMNTQIADIRKDIELLEKKIVNKMYVSLFAYFGLFTTVMTGIMAILIKFL